MYPDHWLGPVFRNKLYKCFACFFLSLKQATPKWRFFQDYEQVWQEAGQCLWSVWSPLQRLYSCWVCVWDVFCFVILPLDFLPLSFPWYVSLASFWIFLSSSWSLTNSYCCAMDAAFWRLSFFQLEFASHMLVSRDLCDCIKDLVILICIIACCY